MIAERLGTLVDDFIAFYNSSTRVLPIRDFILNDTPYSIIIYLEFLFTKNVTISVNSDNISIIFLKGEYPLYSFPNTNLKNLTDMYEVGIIVSFTLLNNEEVPF